jgi:hypothetical protein
VLTGIVAEQLAGLGSENANLKIANSLLLRHALTPAPPPTMGPRPAWQFTPDDLWDIFADFSIESQDMEHIKEREERISIRQRARTEHLVHARQFREWIVAPSSSKLLIHGDFFGIRHLSALSVFCSTLAQALRARPRFLAAVFFCSLHADFDDPYGGPRSMLMGLVAQLLLQHDFDTARLHDDVDMSWDEHGEQPAVADLCALLAWLVRRLPGEMTLFCIVDGVKAFERDDCCEEFVDALAFILDLTIDETVAPTVKVLVTSPVRTAEVREGFEDDCIIQMATMPIAAWGEDASRRRLNHRLGRELASAE